MGWQQRIFLFISHLMPLENYESLRRLRHGSTIAGTRTYETYAHKQKMGGSWKMLQSWLSTMQFESSIWKFTFLFHKSVLWLLYLLLIKPSFNATSSLFTWRPSAQMKLILISSSWRTLLKSALISLFVRSKLYFPFLTLRTLENSLITAPNFLTIVQALMH